MKKHASDADYLADHNPLPKVLNVSDCLKVYGLFFDDQNILLHQVVTLLDPITFKRLSVPCRSINCQHLQCFDYSCYLEMNKKMSPCQFICPICKEAASPMKIYIDNIWILLLERFTEVNKMRIGVDGICSEVSEIKKSDVIYIDDDDDMETSSSKTSSAKTVSMHTFCGETLPIKYRDYSLSVLNDLFECDIDDVLFFLNNCKTFDLQTIPSIGEYQAERIIKARPFICSDFNTLRHDFVLKLDRLRFPAAQVMIENLERVVKNKLQSMKQRIIEASERFQASMTSQNLKSPLKRLKRSRSTSFSSEEDPFATSTPIQSAKKSNKTPIQNSSTPLDHLPIQSTKNIRMDSPIIDISSSSSTSSAVSATSNRSIKISPEKAKSIANHVNKQNSSLKTNKTIPVTNNGTPKKIYFTSEGEPIAHPPAAVISSKVTTAPPPPPLPPVASPIPPPPPVTSPSQIHGKRFQQPLSPTNLGHSNKPSKPNQITFNPTETALAKEPLVPPQPSLISFTRKDIPVDVSVPPPSLTGFDDDIFTFGFISTSTRSFDNHVVGEHGSEQDKDKDKDKEKPLIPKPPTLPISPKFPLKISPPHTNNINSRKTLSNNSSMKHIRFSEEDDTGIHVVSDTSYNTDGDRDQPRKSFTAAFNQEITSKPFNTSFRPLSHPQQQVLSVGGTDPQKTLSRSSSNSNLTRPQDILNSFNLQRQGNANANSKGKKSNNTSNNNQGKNTTNNSTDKNNSNNPNKSIVQLMISDFAT
jgi:hypothetical protein